MLRRDLADPARGQSACRALPDHHARYVFLMVGYAETLFLALAIPAWRSAALDRWQAALLAELAESARPDACT